VPHGAPVPAGVSVQVDVPLHVFVMQSVESQEIAVPRHAPPEQVSP
jgi:hypothetical protein